MSDKYFFCLQLFHYEEIFKFMGGLRCKISKGQCLSVNFSKSVLKDLAISREREREDIREFI